MNSKLFLYNGIIHTQDPHDPIVDAVVMDNGIVRAIGETAILKRWVDDSYEPLDLQGRLVLPGFTDSHTHFAMYSLGLERVSLEGTQTADEALALLKKKASDLPPGSWVYGVDWNKNIWPGGSAPPLAITDLALPNHPLRVVSKCGHLTWTNSLGLALAGINADTPHPEGGEIEREVHTGLLTGVLKENAAELVSKVLPETTPEELLAAMRKGLTQAHRFGLVGIHNCEDAPVFSAFQTLLTRGELAFRVHHHLAMEELDHALALGLRTGFGSPTLNLGSLKLFIDGALGSQTAYMLEPFCGTDDDCGIVVTSKEKLHVLIEKAAENGISSAVHAIGDKANRDILDIFQAIHSLTKTYGLRQRIEHAQLVTANDFDRFKALDVIASVQPLHATSDKDLVDKHWGERGVGAYAFKTFIDKGVRWAYGSDVPVETPDPLKGIYAAVSRRRENEPAADPWYPDQKISMAEAVHGYTMGAAYAAYQEAYQGSLSVGKLADAVVLSLDLFSIPEEEIPGTTVDYTIVGGEIVFARS
jgi:predicted amidohydrolase YtcJ